MVALRRERHDWRTVKLEKRVRKMKEKGLEKGKIGEALQGDRQLTPGGGGGLLFRRRAIFFWYCK